ncbi:MAG: pilus assembly protein PilM [bacterium]
MCNQKSQVSLELGTKQLKLLEFKKKGKDCLLNKWVIEDLPGHKHEDLVGALSAALKNNKINAKHAVLTVSGSDLIYQLLELPEMPAEEVEAAIKFKLEPVLPFPINEAVFDFRRVKASRVPDHHLYFVAVLPKSSLDFFAAVGQKVGLKLAEIIPVSCGLKQACKELNERRFIAVYAGLERLTIALVSEGEVCFAREVNQGEGNLIQLVKDLPNVEGMDLAKARELVKKCGFPLAEADWPEDAGAAYADYQAAVRPFMDLVGAEINRTVEYYQEKSGDQEAFPKIIFTGECAVVKNFGGFFARTFSKEVIILSPSILAGNESAPLLSAVIGAGLAGPDCLRLKEKKEQPGWLSQLEKFRSYLSGFGIYFLLLFMVWGFFGWQHNLLNKQSVELLGNLEKQQAEIGVGSTNEKLLERLVNEIGAKPGQTDRFINLIALLDEETPPDIFFENVRYNRSKNSLAVRGLVLKRQANKMVTDFVEHLKKNPLVDSVRLAYLVESDRFTEKTFEFELECSLFGGEK